MDLSWPHNVGLLLRKAIWLQQWIKLQMTWNIVFVSNFSMEFAMKKIPARTVSNFPSLLIWQIFFQKNKQKKHFLFVVMSQRINCWLSQSGSTESTDDFSRRKMVKNGSRKRLAGTWQKRRTIFFVKKTSNYQLWLLFTVLLVFCFIIYANINFNLIQVRTLCSII